MKRKTLKTIAAFALAFGALAQPAWAALETLTTYTVRNYSNGKCLDVRTQDDAYSNNARVQQWDCSGAWEQDWELIPIGSSGLYFQLRSANSGKCMRVRDASSDDGAQVDQFDCPAIGGGEFRWRVVSMGHYATLINVASGKCLDVSDGSSANGAKIQQLTCNGTNAQKWAFVWRESETFCHEDGSYIYCVWF